MKVLLTRPAGSNQSMSDALRRRGIAHLITPLLSLAPNPVTPEQLQQLARADMLIFISANAVQFAAAALAEGFPAKAEYFAVGQATLDALASHGVSATMAPESCQQTEGLLSLPALATPAGKHITIVRGVGGRELLAQQLIEGGATVQYWELYRRECPPLKASEVCHRWRDAGIDTIVITSGEILQNLLELVPKELFAWLRACHIIVPSTRVEAQALAFGMTQVTNAGAANSQAILAALKL
jgi:uroporphyrinogen-III synthase